MSWLSIILGILKLANVIAGYAERRGALDAATSEVIRNVLQDSLLRIEMAAGLRGAVVRRRVDGGSLRPEGDPNLRD